ncbi:Uncharacterized membrane protein YsdA, DUF1294 family [Gracilibacillus orientalis]|uniref:Uncharacterized membrane protein YsdA, DUF1294 family n=1 Tax=Gracilibacillus orientalis TaxID=334253 RepID=A0A1I4MWY7_9BACI|nr:DUF1294 domain-containing protein [Gracilibacillus orientalis]SFM07596.1 Uncharacterized membrane protein YsdA, DUF1294 family [Gracilibacillus orientalis]
MFIYLVIINIISLLTMWIDKRKARKNKWRIPEGRIWLFAIIGGALGATIGMHVFRHKTKHTLFLIGLPFIAIIQWVLIIMYYI